MSGCPVCGARMVHFENPSRWLCPQEKNHRNAHVIARGIGKGKGKKKPKKGE